MVEKRDINVLVNFMDRPSGRYVYLPDIIRLLTELSSAQKDGWKVDLEKFLEYFKNVERQ